MVASKPNQTKALPSLQQSLLESPKEDERYLSQRLFNHACIAKALLFAGLGLNLGLSLDIVLWQWYQMIGRAAYCDGALETHKLFGLDSVIRECLPDPIGWGIFYAAIVLVIISIGAWIAVWKYGRAGDRSS